MASEKFGRSGLAGSDPDLEPPHSHKGFYDWVRLARGLDVELRHAIGVSTRADFRAAVSALLSVSQALESLAPALAKQRGTRMNPEYPWHDGTQVVSPLEFPFATEPLAKLRVAKLVTFLDRCIAHYAGLSPLI